MRWLLSTLLAGQSFEGGRILEVDLDQSAVDPCCRGEPRLRGDLLSNIGRQQRVVKLPGPAACRAVNDACPLQAAQRGAAALDSRPR